jgi:phosphatidate cytidylyltransferase
LTLLGKRLISAAILISCTLGFVALDIWAPNFSCPGIWLLPLGFYLIFGSAVEAAKMISSTHGSMTAPTLIGTMLVMMASVIPLLWPLSGSPYPSNCSLGPLGLPLATLAIVQLACFAYFFWQYTANSGVFVRAVLAGWLSSYFGACFAFALAIRKMEPAGWGLFLIVGVIVVTKCADSGAYFCGRMFGKTKLCPTVSPNKTVEGLMGGMIVACLASWLYFTFGSRSMFVGEAKVSMLGVILLGIVLTLAGLVGDLLESVFKRETGHKDSGKLLPGMGGLWDVTDSLLPAFVGAYLLFQSGLIRAPVL